MATSHFNEWHDVSTVHTAGFHDQAVDSERLIKDRNYFLAEHQVTGIPDHLLELVWESLQSPLVLQHPTKDILMAQSALTATPTFEEFEKQLASTPHASAPGPTGLTYNMIASLPQALQRSLYDHLVHLWNNRAICEFWKWRILSPLPKVDSNITINDIRRSAHLD